MATNSTQKSLLIPAQGDFSGSWGTQVSSNTFLSIDACFGAQVAITLTGSDHTVSTSETQAPIHNASGTLSTDVSIVYPVLAGGYYIIENLTTGAHTVTAKPSGGTGVVIPQTSRAFVKIDPSETAAKFAAIPDLLTTRGDIVTRSATTYSRLAVGAANKVLTSDGTDVGWSYIFPSGTLMLFQQTAAPTGWTKQSTHNDKGLRVVSGTASSGGSTNFSTVFGQSATGGHGLVSGENGPHAHSYSGTTSGASVQPIASGPVVSNTNNTGGANRITGLTPGDHTHTYGGDTSIDGSGTPHTHPISLVLKYVDVIIASKD